MEGMTMGAGLAALGFWLFIGIVVVGGIWQSMRERELKNEAMIRLVETGRDLDDATLEKLLKLNTRTNTDLLRELKIGGFITLGAAVGLVFLGLALAVLSEKALFPLLGVAAIVACMGGALLYAAKYVESWPEE